MYIGNTNTALQDAIELRFVEKLRMLGSHWFKLDGDLFIGPNIGPVINVTECATSKLSRESVFATHA